MPAPFTLAERFGVEPIDPTKVSQASTFYYSDLSTIVRDAPNTTAVIDYDAKAIAGQIEIILGTPIGSEEHEPTFGSEVAYFQFDTLNNETLNKLETKILSSLRMWLGRRAFFSTVTLTKNAQRGDVITTIPFVSRLSGRQYSYTGNITQLAKGGV